jgi:hypothetical protein
MSNYKSTSDDDYPASTHQAYASKQSSGAWIIGGIAALLLIAAIGWLASGNSPAPVGTPPATQSTTEAPAATPAAPADPAAPATPPAQGSGSTTTQ